MTVRHLLLVLLLVSSAAVNAATVTVDPPDPTSASPVVLVVTEHDSCPPDPVVTRDGFAIQVTLGAGICLFPPVNITHRLDLGTLPAGTYTVTVTDESDDATVTQSFVVLDAGGVTVSPSIGKRGTQVRIFADLPCPGHTICRVPDVFFGGVQVFSVRREGDHWVAVVPNHAPGLVEVRVANDQTTKSAFAFRYIDEDAPPSEVLFEKVLIPIAFSGPGAFGSQWVTEVSVRNDEPFDIIPWRPFFTSVNFLPGAALTAQASGRPQGTIVYLPRIGDENVHFNVLVRDTTRENDDWGTQIPVLREDELKPGPKELLNVPIDPRYRLTLRLYSLSPAPTFAKVTMYTMTIAGGLLHERIVPLNSAEPCQPNVPCTSDHPAFAMVGDLPTNFGGLSTVGIQIDGIGQPVWGFLTVTNNETQRVTVISPE